jgi:hypothetical protein
MTTPHGPLDPAGDPDRFDPDRAADEPSGPLDWALDPDRYDPAADAVSDAGTDGRRSTLPELIGADRSFQDAPSPYVWVAGLIGVVAFLLLVAFVFSHVSPG